MSLIKFKLTEDHLKLIKNLDIEKREIEQDVNVPSISPKTPFGNIDIFDDIFLIIYGVTPITDYNDFNMFGEDIKPWTQEQYVYMKQLLSELNVALEIVLNTQSFVPGEYKTKSYVKDWKLI